MGAAQELSYNGTQFDLVFGDPGAVEAAFDGSPLNLGGEIGQILRLELNADDMGKPERGGDNEE